MLGKKAEMRGTPLESSNARDDTGVTLVSK